MLTIEGVPQTITREQVVDLVRALGIDDPKQVKSLKLNPRSIEAEVYATDVNGYMYVADHKVPPKELRAAVHTIHIQIVDPADPDDVDDTVPGENGPIRVVAPA